MIDLSRNVLLSFKTYLLIIVGYTAKQEYIARGRPSSHQTTSKRAALDSLRDFGNNKAIWHFHSHIYSAKEKLFSTNQPDSYHRKHGCKNYATLVNSLNYFRSFRLLLLASYVMNISWLSVSHKITPRLKVYDFN